MPKCPRCQGEIELLDNEMARCKNCNSLYRVKPSEPQQAEAPQTTEEQPPQTTEYAQPVMPQQAQDVNSELETLKARLAALEAENKQKSVKKQFDFKEKLAPVLTFVKSYGKIIFPVTLAVIVFITLMTCLVGIRGIYVNVNDPNDFYSFTATNYVGYSSDPFMGDYVEKGTWKTSGSKLTLTVKDEDFGKFSADFVYSTKNGYKTLFIGEDKDSLVEYKRVSLVKYDINTAKAKVTFDMNGGDGSNSTKNIKIGNTLTEPNEPTHPLSYTFRGWYTEPYGYKNGGTRFDEDNRIWENVTYYANWYNPTLYKITLGNKELTALEGDNILSKLQTTETEGYTYDYYIDGVLIDDQTAMPDRDITVSQNNKRGKQYTAYFNADGGEFSIEQLVFTFGSNLTLPSAIPINKDPDKVFIGWEYYFEIYEAGASIETINRDMYFIVKWGEVFEFALLDDGYELTKYNDSTATACIIPSTYYNLPVVSIGKESFYRRNKLTSITIPDSVTSIGDSAFSLCSSLTSITIPDSVANIGNNTFSSCSNLTSITVSQGNPIYHSANNCLIKTDTKTLIQGCNTSIIPDDGTVTSIGNSAFSYCSSLISITIPNSVTSIGDGAFSLCSGLTSINIPDSVISIGGYAFVGCDSLTSITIPDSVTSIGNCAFEGCSGLTSITIPDSVTSIGDAVFEYCSSLTSITIPDSVISISSTAFQYCSELKEITYQGTKAQWLTIEITMDQSWQSNTVNFTIHCTDGDLDKYGNDI